METREDEDIVIEKPCDISIIENENKYLKEYFDIFDNKRDGHDDEYIDNDVIEKLKEEHDDLDNSIKSLILERPNKIQR